MWIDHYGWQIPDAFTAADAEVAAARGSVGLADVSWMVKFDLKGGGLSQPFALGGDARVWDLGPLHDLVTCEPPAREGC